MQLPNYKNGSIVNLMQSILQSYDSKKNRSNTVSDYKQLQELPAEEITQAKNVIFLIVDGFGYEYLQRYGKKSIFAEHLRGKITSVFPSTTAAAITTLNTGVAPQQHGLTGWYMYLREIGIVTAILPFTPRIGGVAFSRTNVDPRKIFTQQSIFEKIHVAKYIITANNIINSDYSVTLASKAKRIGYNTLNQFFSAMKKTVSINTRKKFIYAYWPYFDSLCHHYGTQDKKNVYHHFQQLDKKMKKLVADLQGSNTMIIITADHGLINTTEKKAIFVDEHPEFKKMLALPLTGERRAAYCYVRAGKEKAFEQYVHKHFSKQCWLFKSTELVQKNWYGLGMMHDKLLDRIGDYVLVMKENYVILDELLGEERSFHLGTHGGVSKEEMFVPLIVIKC